MYNWYHRLLSCLPRDNTVVKQSSYRSKSEKAGDVSVVYANSLSHSNPCFQCNMKIGKNLNTDKRDSSQQIQNPCIHPPTYRFSFDPCHHPQYDLPNTRPFSVSLRQDVS